MYFNVLYAFSRNKKKKLTARMLELKVKKKNLNVSALMSSFGLAQLVSIFEYFRHADATTLDSFI